MSIPRVNTAALPPDYALRAATNADAEAARDIVFSALREHGLEPSPEDTDADLYDIEQHYHANGGCFDVLIEAATGEIVGTIGLHPDETGTVELRKMYLRPGHRGRGCGRCLLEHALATARRYGFRRVILESTSKLPKAVALYHAYGFRPYTAKHCAPRCDQTLELHLTPP
jgi:putative acetyltransferase